MTNKEVQEAIEEKAKKMAAATAKITEETLKDQAKDEVKDVVMDHISGGEVLNDVLDHVGYALYAAPEIADGLKVYGENMKVVVRVVAEVAIEEVLEKQGTDIKAGLEREAFNLARTPKELAEIDSLHRADDEKREALDAQLERRQSDFEKRHPDADSAQTKKLQEELDKKFEEMRRALELKLLADRTRTLDGRER